MGTTGEAGMAEETWTAEKTGVTEEKTGATEERKTAKGQGRLKKNGNDRRVRTADEENGVAEGAITWLNEN